MTSAISLKNTIMELFTRIPATQIRPCPRDKLNRIRYLERHCDGNLNDGCDVPKIVALLPSCFVVPFASVPALSGRSLAVIVKDPAKLPEQQKTLSSKKY